MEQKNVQSYVRWAIFGPMFSGKTTRLLLEVNKYATVCPFWKCLIICPPDDNRETEANIQNITSHNGLLSKLKPNIDVKRTYDIMNLNVEKYSVIGIDEGQFQTDLEQFMRKHLREPKHILVSALDGTYEMKPFPKTKNTCNPLSIIPMCSDVIKLNAKCKVCAANGNIVDAPYTKLMVEKENNKNGKKLIGGSEIYMPVCIECF